MRGPGWRFILTKLKLIILSLTIIASLFSGIIIGYAQEAVAHAVLFYSPTCGHCEYVITEVIPPLIDQYGKQFQIIGIDVSQEGGSAFYQAAIQRFAIPENRLGVPTLVINEIVLVGSGEIPDQLPLIIESTLKDGGNDWPDIPGLKEALIAQGAIPEESAEQTPIPVTNTPANPDQPLFISAFMQDPLANGISVGLLLLMIAAVIAVMIFFIRDRETKAFKGPTWIIPLLALIGIVIAGYMSYVEVTRTDAVCGPIGDCNTVQDSIYAKILGIPVGVVGIFGYLGILLMWLIQTYGPANLRTLATRAIWAMGWFGILFSIYLTFLEPFVIGASCAWCLSSAVVMSLIFWFSTGPAQATWSTEEEIEADHETELNDLSELKEAKPGNPTEKSQAE